MTNINEKVGLFLVPNAAPETNITKIEATSRETIKRFILVSETRGGFFHEADGVCFADGSMCVYQTGLHSSSRVSFYRDEDQCTMMNPAYDLRWLDEPREQLT
jgi:hypothetical protein